MGQGVSGGVQNKLEGRLWWEQHYRCPCFCVLAFEVAPGLPLYSKLHAVGEVGGGVLSLHSGLHLPRDGSPVGSWVLLHCLNHLRVGVECRSLLVMFLEGLLRGNAPNHGVS